MSSEDEVPLNHTEPPSKSQRKREAQAILDLAKQLVEMGDKLFKGLTLPEPLREATVLARSITAYGGRKRQILYMAKLMRGIDLDNLRTQLQEIDERAETSKRQHKRLEQLRDRLIDDGDTALAELLHQNPDADRQQIRQLIRNAQNERDRGKPPKSARALFQLLKSL